MTHPDDHSPGRIPDDVPEADGTYVPGGDAVPLETSEPDWQEQRIDVGMDSDDDFR